MIISCDVLVEWSDLHLGEFERVSVTFPVVPFDTGNGLIVVASQVGTVQAGMITFSVPPGTFEPHGARSAFIDIVVLVSGAELLSQMVYHRVAFKQQHVYKLNYICNVKRYVKRYENEVE